MRGAVSALLLSGAALAAPVLVCGQAVSQDLPRVMSLNVCTDQLVLALTDRGQIVSLSNLADDASLSAAHEQAAEFPKNRGLAEEVFIARPDMVVTGTYSLHNTTALLRSQGIPVEEFGFAQEIGDVPGDLRRMGALIGQPERGEEHARRFEAVLEDLSVEAGPDAPTIVLYGQNGVATGSDTLGDSVLAAAGLRNLAAENGLVGMAPYALERLIADRPDVVIVSRPYADAPALADLLPSHPAILAAALVVGSEDIPDGALGCAGPATLGALEVLRALRDDLVRGRESPS